ncbi:exported protein of unknown function [Cupriavidus taiwanensis]|nr:exported protein of unknown function [Cupriavidus taiwanensis]
MPCAANTSRKSLPASAAWTFSWPSLSVALSVCRFSSVNFWKPSNAVFVSANKWLTLDFCAAANCSGVKGDMQISYGVDRDGVAHRHWQGNTHKLRSLAAPPILQRTIEPAS